MDQRTMTLIGGGAAVLIVLVGVAITLGGEEERRVAPPPPPRPRPPEEIVADYNFSESGYRGVLVEDAHHYGVPAPTLEQMAMPMPYALELDEQRKLRRDGDVIETAHLKVTLAIVNDWSGPGTGIRANQVQLRIANKTSRYLAYRVASRMSSEASCRVVGGSPHNADALRPQEFVQRTECLWKPTAFLLVDRIEVMELPPLAYYYVSRLNPAHLFASAKVAKQHEPPKDAVCTTVPWSEIESAVRRDGVEWRDVVDFYARHRCDAGYSFPVGYRYRERPGPLPIRSR